MVIDIEEMEGFIILGQTANYQLYFHYHTSRATLTDCLTGEPGACIYDPYFTSKVKTFFYGISWEVGRPEGPNSISGPLYYTEILY